MAVDPAKIRRELINALFDESATPEQKSETIKTLVRYANEEVVDALLNISEDEARGVRIETIFALGQLLHSEKLAGRKLSNYEKQDLEE